MNCFTLPTHAVPLPVPHAGSHGLVVRETEDAVKVVRHQDQQANLPAVYSLVRVRRLEGDFTGLVRTEHVSAALSAADRDDKHGIPAERLGYVIMGKAFAVNS